MKELGLSDIRTKNRTTKQIESQVIDQLNAKALKELELRQEQRANAKEKVEKTLDRFVPGLGQNPSLTKYKLPRIDDLIESIGATSKRSNVLSRQTHLQKQTSSNLRYKARALSRQTETNSLIDSSQLNQHQDDKIELLNIDTTRDAGPSQLKMYAEDSNLHNGTKYRTLIESQDS